MEALGGYRELASPAREIGSAVFVVMLCLTALLERLQFKLRATETRAWWASNGRDILNAIALGAMALGLRYLGFAGPISFCLAATLVILLTAFQAALGERKRAGLLSVLAALVLGAPVLLLPRGVDASLRSALEWLFG